MYQQYLNAKTAYTVLKILGIICIISMIMSIWIVRSYLAEDDEPPIHVTEIQYCDTKACNETAQQIIHNMNRSVDPCDDFYEYACGGFVKKEKIPDTDVAVDLMTSLSNNVRRQLSNVMTNTTATDEPQAFKKIRKLYHTCVKDNNNTKSDKEYMESLNKLGGWPVVQGNSWNESKFNWNKAILGLEKGGYGNDAIFRLGIRATRKNHTVRSVYLAQGELGLSKLYLKQGLKNNQVKLYFKYMVDVAVFFGANRTQAEKELNETLTFNMKLANFTLDPEEMQELGKKDDTLFTIKELQDKFPLVDWLDYLNQIFDSIKKFNNTERVMVDDPAYFERATSLLKTTPPRTIANYIFWLNIMETVPFLSKPIRDIKTQYFFATTGATASLSREEKCFNHILSFFSIIASSLYVRNYVNNSTKAGVEEMIRDIRQASKSSIEKAGWLDNKTKSTAIEKLDQLSVAVGYPEELLDDHKIDEYFKNWDIVDGNYFQTIVKASQFYQKIHRSALTKPYKKFDWTEIFDNAAEVNAYNAYRINTIVIPAGIIQGYYYNKDRPEYINYAALGSCIGHEIAHTFDIHGKLYNKDGDLDNWWTNQTEKEFLNKAQCFNQQYNNFTLKEVGQKVNGNLTMGENIADNEGLQKSFLAYNNWLMMRSKEEPRLRGLEAFTNKQMFWISYATTWCQKIRPEVYKNNILFNEHSPNKYRVNAPLSNTAEFADSFMCPPNSRMNPTEKCSIW